MEDWSLPKKILGWFAGVAFILGAIFLYNVWFNIAHGSPTIPTLDGRWWAGYYDTSHLGRQWCVARFVSRQPRGLRMVLLSAFGPPDIFEVDRRTSSRNFVYLTFTDPNSDLRIEARQLYLGQRYYLGRLSVGRFRDFWKMNQDVAIRGETATWSPPNEFALEPIGEDRLEQFWREYVRPDVSEPTPLELLRSAGFDAQNENRASEEVR